MRFSVKWLLLSLAFVTQLVWAEPMSLGADQTIPNLGAGKAEMRAYVESGRYNKEICQVTEAARLYLQENLPRFAGKSPAMILDIDETTLSNYPHLNAYDFGYIPQGWESWVMSGKAPAFPGTLELYKYAYAHGVAVFFLSGRNEDEREVTEQNLRQQGFAEWNGLILKTPGSPMTTAEFKTQERREIMKKGFSIVVNVGDQASDLEGGYSESTFKIPNPMYWIP